MSVYNAGLYRTPLLRKIKINEYQDKINELVDWINSDRTEQDKSYLIKEIPEKHLDCCDTIYRKSPLHMAIFKQDIPLIKRLLEYNCNPHLKNPEGKDSYYFAIQTGNMTIFHLIERYQALHKTSCWFCTIL